LILTSYLPEQSSIGAPAAKLSSEKLRVSSVGNEDHHGEETVLDSDLDDLIGISDSSALEVIQQPFACLEF
jgi:DNA repair protein RAD5